MTSTSILYFHLKVLQLSKYKFVKAILRDKLCNMFYFNTRCLVTYSVVKIWKTLIWWTIKMVKRRHVEMMNYLPVLVCLNVLCFDTNSVTMFLFALATYKINFILFQIGICLQLMASYLLIDLIFLFLKSLQNKKEKGESISCFSLWKTSIKNCNDIKFGQLSVL